MLYLFYTFISMVKNIKKYSDIREISGFVNKSEKQGTVYRIYVPA